MLDNDKLCKKYNRVLTKTFYTETIEAWDGLIEDFVEEMNEAAKAFKEGSIHIDHMKEKFGSLRIYVDYHLPDDQITELEKIVSRYEHFSLKICTVCGNEDKKMHQRKGYWDIIQCQDCFEKNGDKNGR